MNKQFKRIRLIIMWALIAFGIGMFILIQIVKSKGLTEWQQPTTLIFWIYLVLVLIYILFLNAIPMVWNHFKKR